MGSSNLCSKAERRGLISALIAVAVVHRVESVRRFLEGLSGDELAYIAAFVGAGVLDPDLCCPEDREDAARQIERYEACRLHGGRCNCASDQSPDALRAGRYTTHKMILLLEYVSLANLDSSQAWLSPAAHA